MLERKFAQYLEQFLSNEPNKILLVNTDIKWPALRVAHSILRAHIFFS